MATDVERVQDWRAAKLKAGYQLTSVWFKQEDKRYLEDLARARHQSLSDCLLDGLRALPAIPRKGKAPVLLSEDQLDALLDRKLAERTGQAAGEAAPTAGPTMPLCKNGLHPKPYPGECRGCRKDRKKRSKDNRKAKQAGAGVMRTLESTAPPDLADEAEQAWSQGRPV